MVKLLKSDTFEGVNFKEVAVFRAIGVLVLGFSLSASATIVPVAATIQADMKFISTNYEKLGRQIDDSAKNEGSRKLALKMIEACTDAQSKTPKAIEKLEGQAKEAAEKKHYESMQGMIDHLASLRDALASNNNAEARKHYDALKPAIKSN